MATYFILFCGYLVLPSLALATIRLRGATSDISFDISNYLKGIGILVIVLHHMSQKIIPPGLLRPYQDFGYLGVSIFILLSGYGLMSSFLKTGSLNGFFSKRIARVYIPFLIINGLFLTFSNGFNDNWEWAPKLFGFELLDGSYWFVIFILYAYLCFYISLKINSILFAPAVVLLSVIVYWIFCYNQGVGKWWYTTALCFPLGVFFASRKNVCLIYLRKKTSIISLVVGLCLFTAIATSQNHLVSSIGKSLSSIFFATLIFLFSHNVKSAGNLAGFIGRHSYEIYLCHVMALSLNRNIEDPIVLSVFILETSALVFILGVISKHSLMLLKFRRRNN